MGPVVTITHRRPHPVQDSSREVTRGPQDVNSIDQTPDIHPIIEALFERLEVGQERHGKCLDKHDKRFEVHEKRAEKQDSLIDQMGEIL